VVNAFTANDGGFSGQCKRAGKKFGFKKLIRWCLKGKS
jgi:hypothetical protein